MSLRSDYGTNVDNLDLGDPQAVGAGYLIERSRDSGLEVGCINGDLVALVPGVEDEFVAIHGDPFGLSFAFTMVMPTVSESATSPNIKIADAR